MPNTREHWIVPNNCIKKRDFSVVSTEELLLLYSEVLLVPATWEGVRGLCCPNNFFKLNILPLNLPLFE